MGDVIYILFFILYIIPSIYMIIYSTNRIYDNDVKSESVWLKICMLSLSFFIVFNLIVSLIIIEKKYDILQIIKAFFKEKIEKEKILKERNKRIKLGIVKFTEFDPFGEETN